MYEQLQTEKKSDNVKIEELSTYEMVKRINSFDKTVAYSVEKSLKSIAALVDMIVEKIRNGGRLFYVGAGSSGRLGVLDAAECPPTYGVSPELVQGVMIGGDGALRSAVEAAEDDAEDGIRQLKERNFSDKDVCVGISASGCARSVYGALEYANFIGAVSAALVCNLNSRLAEVAKYTVEIDVGSEVIMGSTRMKSGTAQKMVLNMLSTSVMVKLGRVKDNMMIYMRPTNMKLKERAVRIVSDVMNISEEQAREVLIRHSYNLGEIFDQYLNNTSVNRYTEEKI